VASKTLVGFGHVPGGLNYVLVGQDKQSPAMRLGLAKGRVSLEDIIYFQE